MRHTQPKFKHHIRIVIGQICNHQISVQYLSQNGGMNNIRPLPVRCYSFKARFLASRPNNRGVNLLEEPVRTTLGVPLGERHDYERALGSFSCYLGCASMQDN